MKKNNETTTVATTATEAYDFSVASRMVGRSGASSPQGGKGIAHEVMMCDKLNMSNAIKGNGYHTQFTKSPTATQVDLVTMDGSKVVSRIQCKDTVSNAGVRKTVEQMKSGKYNAAQMFGTTETAKAVNAKEGLTKVMNDSGISSNTTSRIANKFNGISSTTGITNAMKNSATFGAALNGLFAVADSINNGDDLEDTAKNVVAETAKGAITSSVGTGTAELTSLVLAAAPIPLAAKVVASVVVGAGTGMVASEVIGDDLHDIVDDIQDGLNDFGYEISCAFDDIGDEISNTLDDIGYELSNAVDDFGSGLEEIGDAVADGISDFFSEVDCFFSSWF